MIQNEVISRVATADFSGRKHNLSAIGPPERRRLTLYGGSLSRQARPDLPPRIETPQ